MSRPKHDREWDALELVYSVSDFGAVRHEDSPDFVLQRDGSEPFGVEVTNLYAHEADARVDAHPKYVSELLAGGRHMHRDDIKVLSVTTISIHDKEGKLKGENVPAIFRHVPAPVAHSAALAAIIDRKNDLIANYERGLSHVNLIVVDHFDRHNGFGEEYNASELLDAELRRALRASRFREVFLATQGPDGTWAVRPLQMLRLIEAFYLFLGALVSFNEAPDDLEPEAVASLFVQVCHDRDLDLYFAAPNSGPPCAVHHGAGVRHTGDDINILDFHDFLPPSPTSPPPSLFDGATMRRLIDHLDAFLAKTTFSTGLMLAAAAGPRLNRSTSQ